MTAIRSTFLVLLFVLQVSHPSALLAHGSVVAEGDICVIKIGFYTAHFKIFQPQTSREKEFCEDLPQAGESIFVMEYLHQGLADVPIEFRIVRDATGLGRFARLEDLESIPDLDAVTVFHQPPVLAAQVFSILHVFAQEGDFLGIVTVKHPSTEQYYTAVFPFSVGPRGWGLLPLFAVLGVLAQLCYWISTGSGPRWRAGKKGQELKTVRSQLGLARILLTRLLLVPVLIGPVLLLMGASTETVDGQQGWLSESGGVRVTFQSAVNPIPLNQIHQWTLHLETAAGVPIENASIEMTGGMPAHNHGLPTNPVVTTYLGNGDYRIEGIRFHMQGEWLLTLTITHDKSRDTVLIPLAL